MITINSIDYGEYRLLTDIEQYEYYNKFVNKTHLYDEVPKYKYIVSKPYHMSFNIDNINYYLSIPIGFLSDGATMAKDVGIGWLFHDYIYATHIFDNSNIECDRDTADQILSAILYYENYYIRSYLWYYTMYLNPLYLISKAWDESYRTYKSVFKL